MNVARASSPASASCICGGSGGVGKTTTSAAIAMGLAARRAQGRGRDHRPGQAAGQLARARGARQRARAASTPSCSRPRGVEMEGELWAMMLDPKRTFDDLIDRLAPDDRRRATRCSTTASTRSCPTRWPARRSSPPWPSSTSSTASDDFDLLVLDTPPSRNALDFLDAPDRLTQFFEGRALQVFLRPTGLAARVMGRGTGHGVRRAQAGHRRSTCSRTSSVFFRSLSAA